MPRSSWVGGCAGAVLATLCACAPVPHFKERASGTELILVKGGCFSMGSAAGRPGGPDEKPAHEVCVADFYLGKYEVTQGEWLAVMGSNPSKHQACGHDCPVETVSWNDAQEFVSRLNARSGSGAAERYRLPTEAEWEYAARSGGKGEQDAISEGDLGKVAWFIGNAQGIRRTGTRAPNGLGFHDMSGNVAEWVSDWYDATWYAASPRDNPTGPATGQRKVVRGGSFGDEPFDQRTTYRNHVPPDYRSAFKGFRLARTVPKSSW